MSFSEEDVRTAGKAIALSDEQVDGLLAVLRARQAPGEPAPLPQTADLRIRFDLVHLLWYAGALIVIGAMGLFTTLAFEAMGGAALATTALIYAALFAAAGDHLWHRRGLPTPGGLLIAVAVAMAPLATFGIQDALGWWNSDGPPGRYHGFYLWIKGSWLPMEIVTILAGLLALRFYRFPFIVAIIALALWFMSMDLTPWLFQNEDPIWAARKQVSMMFGLAVLALAWLVDVKRNPRRDFAFWLHLAGLLAFWGGLTLSDSNSEAAKALYCLINVAFVLLSVFLMRRAYALFGTLGVSLYLGYLAAQVFEDSLLFPFALSLIGILVIAAGLVLHHHRGALSAWMSKRLPDTLRKLRPPHADAIRMEHA
jgi:hypothetical protein